MKKSQDAKAVDLVVGKPFSITGVPTRSRPMEYLNEFQALLDELPSGRAVELDAARVTEHRARKYLQILTGKDRCYAEFVVRTASSSSPRRRVFITRPTSIVIAAANGETTTQLKVQV